MRLRTDQLHQHLERNPLAPLYLVSGDEPLQQTETIDAIRSKARKSGFEERVLLEVDKSFDWNRLLQENASLSLFASRKIIELRLGGHKPGREGGATLIEYADQAPTDNLLIISCEKLDKRTQQSKWFKALDRAGISIQIWPVDAGRLPDWIQQRFKANGKRIESGSAELIAQRVEGNLLAANQEINKLCLLVKDDVIGMEDVAAAVVDSARFDVFEMMEAAWQGDLARATRMLYGFRNEGVEPMAIYGAILWNCRQLATLAHQIATGTPVDQVLASQRGLNNHRKAALKSVIRRHDPEFIQGLLIPAGRIDRVIKGNDRPLTWHCFHELLKLMVLGASSQAVLINSMTG